MLEKIKAMKQSNTRFLIQIKRWQVAWNSLEKLQADAFPDAALQRFYITQLVGWSESFPQHQGEFSDIEKKVNEDYKDMMRRYKSLLQDACHSYGYHLEGESGEFTVDGLIKIRIDKEQNQATINGKKIPNLSTSLVAEAVAKTYKQIWQRDIDSSVFFMELLNLYAAVCDEKAVAAGEFVSIRDIYRKMRERKKKYTLDIFAADLSRLIENDIESDEKGNRLVLAPVRDPRKAIYVYDRQRHNGRYLGVIRFEKEKTK